MAMAGATKKPPVRGHQRRFAYSKRLCALTAARFTPVDFAAQHAAPEGAQERTDGAITAGVDGAAEQGADACANQQAGGAIGTAAAPAAIFSAPMIAATIFPAAVIAVAAAPTTAIIAAVAPVIVTISSNLAKRGCAILEAGSNRSGLSGQGGGLRRSGEDGHRSGGGEQCKVFHWCGSLWRIRLGVTLFSFRLHEHWMNELLRKQQVLFR
jgi:hypothetical protein